MTIEGLKNKKIAVLGFGKNNWHLIFWLLRHQIPLTICDQNSAIQREAIFKTNDEEQELLSLIKEWRVGESFLKNLTDFEIIFRTPGLPYLTPEIQAAKSAGVEISSQTELFLRLAPCQVIGVTGTKGKSTTAAMIAHLLEKSKVKSQKSKLKVKSKKFNQIYLAGNIGLDPFVFLDELRPEDIVVLELSSFQLQGISVSPPIAVMTRVTADHLDHHQSVEEYYEAKVGLIKNQRTSDWSIINVDESSAEQFIKIAKSQIIRYSSKQKLKSDVCVRVGDSGQAEVLIVDVKNSASPQSGGSEVEMNQKLVGRHNLENWAAAVAVGYFIFDFKAEECREALKNFTALPYRLEFLKEIRGIRFYNDSYATNPAATIVALESFKSSIILICGGSSKNANFTNLAQTICRQKVKAVLAIGEEGPKIIAAIRKVEQEESKKKKVKSRIIEEIGDFRQAVERAVALASSGDVVLLSPACASFGMFKNATERGEVFRKIVENI